MNLRYIIYLAQLFFCTTIFAQKEYNHKGLYTSLGYEIGFLSSKVKEIKAFENIKTNTSLSHTGSISVIYKTPLKAEIKLGYALSYNNLPFEGIAGVRNFKVENNYYSHSVFLGAGYNFPLKKDIDITLSLGSSLSFVKKQNISEEKGDLKDKITSTNNSVNNGNAFIIPEISVTKYFNNNHFVSLGIKYNYSVSDALLNGSIQHVSNNSVLRQLDYTTQNNNYAIYLCYGFKFI